MRFTSRRPLRSNAVLTRLGTFVILMVSGASDAMAAGTWSTTGSMTVARGLGYTATLLPTSLGRARRADCVQRESSVHGRPGNGSLPAAPALRLLSFRTSPRGR